MKTVLLSLFVLFFGFARAQDYIPMLQENHTWSVDVYYGILPPCDPDPCQYTVTSQISLGEIESIGGLDYYRVVSDNSNTCLLREDNGFIYKYDEDNLVDRLLFDFTLEVGDVFLFEDSAYNSPAHCMNHTYGFGGNNLEVTNVNFVELAGELRKVITFDQHGSFGNYQWIEGIGNISGFDFMWAAIDFTDGSQLVCFETNGNSYFFNDATSCDNTTLGLTDLNKSKAVLFPNPVTNTSILQFSAEGVADMVQIYNVSGSMVKALRVTSDYVLIDVMDYRSGLYFYQVYSEENLLKTEKFIIK